MVQAGEALLYVRVGAMRISRAVDPGGVVQASGIDDQRVVPLPVADGVSVIPRIGRTLSAAPTFLGSALPSIQTSRQTC